MWMVPKKEFSMRRKLGLKFYKYTFGKRTNASSAPLTSHFPEQKKSTVKGITVLKLYQPWYLPTSSCKELKLSYYTNYSSLTELLR